jgi:flagellar basal-body rod protein FlgB
MPSPIAADSTTSLLAKLMTISQERQGVLANNMANANTPGYTRMDVEFQQELSRLLERGEDTSVGSMRVTTVEDPDRPAGNDGNNILLPLEMNAMMENGLMYNLLTKAYATRIGILRTAIDGGGA